MYKLDSFTIYIQTFTLTVLAILSTLVVSGGALCCVLPMCLWLCHLGTGHPGPYSSPPLEALGFYKIFECGKQTQSSCLRVKPTV